MNEEQEFTQAWDEMYQSIIAEVPQEMLASVVGYGLMNADMTRTFAETSAMMVIRRTIRHNLDNPDIDPRAKTLGVYLLQILGLDEQPIGETKDGNQDDREGGAGPAEAVGGTEGDAHGDEPGD